MDKTFKLIGGNGPSASIGPMWSWVAWRASPASASSLAILSGRRQRIRFKFPAAADLGRSVSSASSAASLVLGATGVVNSYPWPPKVVGTYALDNGIPILPASRTGMASQSAWRATRSSAALDGLSYQTGYPIPVLIALASVLS